MIVRQMYRFLISSKKEREIKWLTKITSFATDLQTLY
jgi:hypothetical protein